MMKVDRKNNWEQKVFFYLFFCYILSFILNSAFFPEGKMSFFQENREKKNIHLILVYERKLFFQPYSQPYSLQG
jgi:hypothetical protein